MLEHRTQIHLRRIIRQILLKVFSVALIQSLLHDLSPGVCPLAVPPEPRLHIIIISQSLFNVDSTAKQYKNKINKKEEENFYQENRCGLELHKIFFFTDSEWRQIHSMAEVPSSPPPLCIPTRNKIDWKMCRAADLSKIWRQFKRRG